MAKFKAKLSAQATFGNLKKILLKKRLVLVVFIYFFNLVTSKAQSGS